MNLESRLRSIASSVSDGHLRSFACNCCRRLIPLFNLPILDELISAGEKRSVNDIKPNDIIALRAMSTGVYDSFYSGYGDPSAATLAVRAAGEVAFTESSLDAAINSTTFAAQAIAKMTASKSNDEKYDAVFESVYATEQSCQLEILEKSL